MTIYKMFISTKRQTLLEAPLRDLMFLLHYQKFEFLRFDRLVWKVQANLCVSNFHHSNKFTKSNALSSSHKLHGSLLSCNHTRVSGSLLSCYYHNLFFSYRFAWFLAYLLSHRLAWFPTLLSYRFAWFLALLPSNRFAWFLAYLLSHWLAWFPALLSYRFAWFLALLPSNRFAWFLAYLLSHRLAWFPVLLSYMFAWFLALLWSNWFACIGKLKSNNVQLQIWTNIEQQTISGMKHVMLSEKKQVLWSSSRVFKRLFVSIN